jgi:hypothetical protein
MEKNCQVKGKGRCTQCSRPICLDHKIIHEANCSKTKSSNHHGLAPISRATLPTSPDGANTAVGSASDTNNSIQEQDFRVTKRNKVIYSRFRFYSFCFKFLN